MTIKECYEYAIEYKATHVICLLRYLIHEKQLITFTDDIRKLDYYLQPHFKESFNARLQKYKEKVQIQQLILIE